MPSGRDGCGPPGSDPPSESDGSVSPGALSRIGIAAGFPRRFGSFPPAACGRDRRTPFRDPSEGGRPVRPRNAIRTAEPLRTGSGLESRDNGKYGCPGHKGRVMNMRWGRFGSINICLLIDWCNEPTKKIPLGAGRLSFGRFGNPVRRSPAPDFGAGASGRVALGFKIFMLQYDSGGEYAP